MWVQAPWSKASSSLTVSCSPTFDCAEETSPVPRVHRRTLHVAIPYRSHHSATETWCSWSIVCHWCSSFLFTETEECHLKILFMLKKHYIPHSFSNACFSVFFKLHCGWTVTYLYAQCILASAQIAWNSLNTMINYGISLYLFLHSCKQASVFLELICFMSHISMTHTRI